MRQEMFGVNASGEKQQCSYDGGESIDCYYTPVRTQQQLDSAGFTQVHDTIIRISKKNLASVKPGKKLTLFETAQGDLTVRVDEFGNSGGNPEWVLGCKSLF